MAFKKERLESFLLREVGDFLDKNPDKEVDTLVSITGVILNDALEKAEIMISVFPEKKAEEEFKKIKRLAGETHRHIARLLKSKKNPQIIFVLDKSQAERMRLEKLLENIENK